MGVQFAGNILVQSNGGPLPISQGGTGQTTATGARTALLPVQTNQAGKVLATNGTDVFWTTGGSGTPGGSDTQIQFNDSGTFGGISALTVNKSTGALTSGSTVTATGFTANAAEGTARSLRFLTSTSNRWTLQVDSAAESGANAGSNLELIRYADNGTTQNSVFTVSRASGVVDFKATPTVNGVAIGGGTYTAGTGLTLSGNQFSLTTPVAPANLGSGTANSTTFLRGDGTWAAPVASSATVLFGTGSFASTWNATQTAVWAGTKSGGSAVAFSNASASTGNRLAFFQKNTDGRFHFYLTDDTNAVSQSVMSIYRSGNTATQFNVLATAINLTGAVTGTSFSGDGSALTDLDAGSLSTGTVTTARLGTGTADSTTYLRGDGTWATPTATAAPAGTLTGTTLAANVVSSSLTSVGTITSGTWSGSFGAVSGANLTNLNASNLASGTVGTARLGSGTANSTTFLRGDGSWATPTAAATVLNATGTPSSSSATTAVYAGVGGGRPTIVLTNSAAGTNQKWWNISMVSGASGTFQLSTVDDANTTETPVFAIGRSGTTATTATLSTTALNFPGLTSGLQFNGSAGTTGQVLTSQGNAAAPIWSSLSVSALSATSASPRTSATTGVYAGTIISGTVPVISLTAAGGAADNKVAQITMNSAGQLQFEYATDALAGTSFLTVNRVSGTADASLITMRSAALTYTPVAPAATAAGGAINLTSGPGGATSGNGGAFNLTAGSATTTGVGGNFTFTAGSAAGAGVGGSMTFNSGAAAGTSAGGGFTVTAGTGSTSGAGGVVNLNAGQGGATGVGGILTIRSGAGGATSGASGALNVLTGAPTDGNGGSINITAAAGAGTNRSGGTVTITAGDRTGTGTAGNINLALPATGTLRLNNLPGTAGQVIASNGSATPPTWVDPETLVSYTASTAAAPSRNASTTTVWTDIRGGGAYVSLARSANAVDNRAWSFELTSATLGLKAHSDDFTSGSNAIQFTRTGTTPTAVQMGANTHPITDNTASLGLSGNRWTVVYATTGAINTSDANTKQDIEELSDAERRVASRIKMLVRKFRFKDAVIAKGSAARIHVGVIAQDVEAAFNAEGLDANMYGMFCSDTWTDEQGVEHTRLGIRYEELLAFIIAVS